MTDKRFGMNLVTPMDMPLKKEVKERPERVPTFRTDVMGPALLFFFLGFMVGVGVYALFAEGAIRVVRMMLAGFALGGVVGGVVGFRQLRVFNLPLTSWHEREWQDVVVAEEVVEPIVQPWVQGDGVNGRSVIRIGKFEFTEAEWVKLAGVLMTAEGKVTRAVLRTAGIFVNTGDKFNEYVAEMERLGWVADGELTNRGWEWFGQFAPPPHRENGRN